MPSSGICISIPLQFFNLSFIRRIIPSMLARKHSFSPPIACFFQSLTWLEEEERIRLKSMGMILR